MSFYEPRVGQRLSRSTKKKLSARNRGAWTEERRKKISDGVKRALERRKART